MRASQPLKLARREAGGGRGRHAPEAAGRQTRTRAAADGSDTVRPASLAGPVRPALVSIRWVGLGEGSPSPWSWGVPGGEPCSTSLESEPDRLRSAISTCACVSKTDGSQSLDLQRGALETAGVDEVDVYRELASGVRDARPGLDSCQRVLHKGDVLVVWKLDRLGRNLARLVNTVQNLSARDVGQLDGDEGADRHHDRDRLVFGIFATPAEFEGS